jgi:hypothetical protein
MTYKSYSENKWGDPDSPDYSYRFSMNNDRAWHKLRMARLRDRFIEMYPKKMKHLRVKIDHVTLTTHDKKGYIEGMKKYAVSPDWEVVPYSRGKREMRHANGGGSKIRAEERTGEEWGTLTVETHVDFTPGEIREAFENGVNETTVARKIQYAIDWAVEDRIDTLQEERAERRRELLEECDHPEDCLSEAHHPGWLWCELCEMDYAKDELEYELEQRGEESKVAV